MQHRDLIAGGAIAASFAFGCENERRDAKIQKVFTGGFALLRRDKLRLPPARREKYEQSGRNSKVLVKKLK